MINLLPGCLCELKWASFLCPFDEIVYICSNEEATAINWRLELLDGETLDLNLNSNFEHPGTSIHRQIHSSSVKAEVISGNKSSIVSSLTITVVTLEFNSSKIRCNGETTTLTLPECKLIFLRSSVELS